LAGRRGAPPATAPARFETQTFSPHATLHDLVRGLEASGGFIAVKDGNGFTVIVSVNALAEGQRLELADQAADTGQLRLIGPQPRPASALPKDGWVGQPRPHDVTDCERAVEQALRQLSDYMQLGQSGLVSLLGIERPSQIERGKVMRQILIDGIENLRPAGAQPKGALAREWQAYTILHDAYIEDVPNREIMSKLFISEGTFHRQRRKALNAVAVAIWEIRQPVAGGRPEKPDADIWVAEPTSQLAPSSL